MKWKWSNIPIPEAYLAALLAGAILQRLKPPATRHCERSLRSNLFFPTYILRNKPLRLAAAASNLLAGALLAAWSVASAGSNELSRPQALVTGGPYRFSRNPMYLAWTLLSSGLALLLNSLWMLAALPFAFLYLHLVEIPREEEILAERFGEQYHRYCRRVRRYL